MSDLSAFHTLLQAAHNAAEAQRVELAKVRGQLAAANQKTMEETIRRLEAEKATIEAQNMTLEVTADAAKANAAKAEAARVAAEEAAASGSSSSGGDASTA